MISEANKGWFNRILVLILLLILIRSQCPTTFNCTSCPQGCDVCSTDITLCDTCSKGYYIDSSFVCNTCPTGCLNCSTPYVCNECTPGYDTYQDDNGYQACSFSWWKWFLIIFGTLLGVGLLIILFYCIRQKLKEEDTKNKEIQYEMKLQRTQSDVS